jgi:hypothetical protein
MDLRRKNLRRRGNRVKDNRSRTSALEKIDRLEWVDYGQSALPITDVRGNVC